MRHIQVPNASLPGTPNRHCVHHFFFAAPALIAVSLPCTTLGSRCFQTFTDAYTFSLLSRHERIMAPFDDIFSPIGIIDPKSSNITELQRSYSTASSLSSSGRLGDAVNSSVKDPLSRRPRLSRGESMSTGSKGAQNFFGKERALSNSFTCVAAISEEKSPESEVATKNTDINALLTHIPATNTSWISSLSIGRTSDNKPMSLTATNKPAARRPRSESIDEAVIQSFVCSPPPPPPQVDGVAAKTF